MPPHWHSRLGFLILSILPPHVLAAWGTVTLTPLQPTPVAGHSATLIRTDGNRALACVVGGVTGGNIPTSQIAFLDLSVPSPTWWTLPFNDTVVPPIAGHTAHVIHPMKDGKFDMSDPPFVMLLYGVTSWNPRKYFSISDGKTDVSIAEMDLASDRASDVVDGFNTGSTAPIQRVRHSSAVQYSQWTLYLYGGVVGGSEDNISQELWSMNMNSKLWTRMPDPPDNDPPPTAESGASMLLVQNERYLLICFGIHRRPTNGCSLFDTVNNVWNATSIDSGSAEPAPRASATLTHLKLGSSEFALLFAGGNYGDGTAYNDLWALDLSKLPALCWRPIILCENSSVPAARFDHSMIALSDNYFFMWGGHSSLYEQPDGTVHFLEVRLSEDGTLHGTWSLNYEIPDVIIVDSGYKVSTGTQTERAPVISRGPDSTRNGNRGGEANGAASSTFPTPTFANPHGTITPSATPSGDPNRATSNSLGVVLLAALGVILGVMLFRFWKTFKKEPGDRFVLAFEKAMVYSSCWQFSWCWLTRKRRPQLENRTSQICPQSSGTQITMSLGRRSSATVINVMTSSGQRSGARNAGSVAVHREPTITSGTTCARSLRSDRADERRSQFFEDFENEEELSKDRSQPGLVPGTSIQSGALLLGPVPTVSEDFSEVIDVWRGYDSAEPHTLFQGQSSQTSNHGQILFGVQEFSPEHPLGFDSVSVRDSGGLSWFPRGGELAGSDNQDYQALPLFRTNTGHSGFPHIDVARTHSRHSLLTTPVEMVRSSSSQTYHSMVELIPVCHSPVELIPMTHHRMARN
ncbi:hypothetical protein BJ742DRAFT_273067 [Cladochytrium replicatum]|nr:hypothetical protein BJ742DRAFT_273067 [Cladochytrium replicatum]